MLAMGLTVLGAPVSRAQSKMAAGEAAGGSEATTTSAASVPAAAPADLDRRIEALEMELSELRTELTAKKEAETAAAVATPGLATSVADDAKPAEKTTIASLLGPTSISGFVDTYYQVNFNHPYVNSQLGTTGGISPTGFRSFDFRSHEIALNMIEVVLDKAPDPMGGLEGRTGYHLSLGFGDAMNAINSSDPANKTSCFAGNNTGLCGGFAQYLKEAYFSYLAPVGSGLQVDVGKFVTPMGAEVIESKDNWNYSRGLLFSYAIPYYHFGARAKYNLNSKYNVTGFLVNGWNNIGDNNTGKTYGFSFVGNPTKTASFTVNYLAGPEENNNTFGSALNVNNVWRQTWDAIATYNPTAKLSLMANFDYGRGDRFVISGAPGYSAPVYWTGGAGYVKYAIDANDYVAGRYEYFEDHDGFVFGSTGSPFIPLLHIHEVTATYQRTIATHLLTRLEYRRDMSQFPIYQLSNFNTGVKNQDTASISMIFLFDSRDAK
jgi:Putative beta-barrel porin-2, OmpL-like. bbp2